jgi:glutamyl-tRNA(Gln) amidotransferase subunit E
MYPETDVPPVPVTQERLRALRSRLPERPAEMRERIAKEHSIPAEVARQLVASGDVADFEHLVRRGHSPAIVARLLSQDVPGVPARPGTDEPPSFSLETLDVLLHASEEGRFAKEGFPVVLAALAAGAPNVDQALEASGLSLPAGEDLAAIVTRIVDANRTLVHERGPAAFSALMGDVMREVRGRRDGREVADALHRAIARVESEPAA